MGLTGCAPAENALKPGVTPDQLLDLSLVSFGFLALRLDLGNASGTGGDSVALTLDQDCII